MELRPVIKNANPHIHIAKTPMNLLTNYNDPDYDETVPPLYHGFLSDKNLKVNFAVIWNNKFETMNPNHREFQVVKYDALYLHGIDREAEISHSEQAGMVSVNPEIVHMLFQKVLDPYGIKLENVVMHDYKDFESTQFVFESEALKAKLEDLIDYTFRKNLT